MDILSLFNSLPDTADDLLDTVDSLIPSIDFNTLFAEATDVVDDAIADMEQVVDSTTQLVVNTLTSLGTDIEVVDISNLVEDAISFIGELPEDATLSDALSDIVDLFADTLPDLSDDDLLDLLTDVNELLDDIVPNLSQLSITPLLEQGVDLLEELVDSTGTITINGSSLSGELTQDGSTRSFTTDLSDELDALFDDVDNFLTGLTGTASLSDGEFTGRVASDGTEYDWSFNITDALTEGLTSLLSTTEITLPFEDGVLSVDLETAFGAIEGTVDFAGGDLDIDLTTPLGDVNQSVAFAEDTQFSVPDGLIPGVDGEIELDLSTGLVSVPFTGFTTVVPLEAFSGEVGLSDGVGTFTISSFAGLPIGSVSTTLDIGPLASQVAIALTEDLTGDLTIDAGEITGTIDSGFGEFDLMASFDDLILQASSAIDATTGELTLDNGVASIALNTPFGDLAGAIALSPVEDALTTASSLLT